jgi:hypothetical protein
MSHHRYRLVLTSLLALAFVTSIGLSDGPAFAGCSQADRNAGECRSIDGSTSDDTVTIRVDSSTPGSSGSGGSTSSSGGSSQTAGGTAQPTPTVRPGPPPPPRLPTLGSSTCEVVIAGMCRGSSPPRNPPAPDTPDTASTIPATPPTPPRSVSELGDFVPDRPGVTIEPGDWSMPRLPTNFVATARTQRQSGELAGWPIEVRFIPHLYHWSFGDGHRSTLSEPGRTWSVLGLRQFQPTPTSHVYARPGTYQASVRVEYRVEFRFVGESWQRLSGTVSSTSPSSRIRVLTVSPLLLGN